MHVFPLPLHPALFELSLPKRKLKEERRKKKMRPIKMESEDPIETLAPSDTLTAAPANVINSLPDTPSTPLPNIKEEWVWRRAHVRNALSRVLFLNLIRLQSCGGDSEQPSCRRRNSHKLFQLVGKHFKGRKLVHDIHGMKSVHPCPVVCSGSGSKNLHFALSARG